MYNSFGNDFNEIRRHTRLYNFDNIDNLKNVL